MSAEVKIFSVTPSLKQWPLPLGASAFIAVTSLVMFVLQILSMPAALAVAVLGVLVAIPYVLRAANTEYAVTNLRVIRRKGLIRTAETSVKLEDITEIGIHWGAWGQALDTATLKLEGFGVDMLLEGVEEPEKVRARILGLK